MENWYKTAKNATFVNQLGDTIGDMLSGKSQLEPQHYHLRTNDIFDAVQELIGMGFSGFSKDPAARARLKHIMQQRGKKNDKELLSQLYGVIRNADRVQEVFFK